MAKKETMPEVQPEAQPTPTPAEEAIPTPISEPAAEPGEELVLLVVPSKGVETIMKDGKKHVYGYINSEKFEVPCDQQVAVSKNIAEVLKPLIKKNS